MGHCSRWHSNTIETVVWPHLKSPCPKKVMGHSPHKAFSSGRFEIWSRYSLNISTHSPNYERHFYESELFYLYANIRAHEGVISDTRHLPIFSIRHWHSNQDECRPTPTLRIASLTLDTPVSPTLNTLFTKSTPDITENFKSTPDTHTPFIGPNIALIQAVGHTHTKRKNSEPIAIDCFESVVTQPWLRESRSQILSHLLIIWFIVSGQPYQVLCHLPGIYTSR